MYFVFHHKAWKSGEIPAQGRQEDEAAVEIL